MAFQLPVLDTYTGMDMEANTVHLQLSKPQKAQAKAIAEANRRLALEQAQDITGAPNPVHRPEEVHFHPRPVRGDKLHAEQQRRGGTASRHPPSKRTHLQHQQCQTSRTGKDRTPRALLPIREGSESR